MIDSNPNQKPVENRKAWYKTWWGILAIILFLWPFVLLWWVWMKSNWNKNVKLAITAVVLLIFAKIIFFSPSASTTSQTLTEKAASPTVGPSAETVSLSSLTNSKDQASLTPREPTSTPIPPTPTPAKTTRDKLTDIVNKKFEDDKDTLAQFDQASGLFTLTYGRNSTFWNEASAVEGMFAILVTIGKEAFQINDVKNFKVVVENKLTDQYGQESVETVASVNMNKSEFQKFNWDNLRFQPIYYPILNAADDLYIHPAFLKNIGSLGNLKLKY